ncbi:hypothetical protein GZL_07896 [Streptomyces sp. 769]|nr:hypothetical protein GZL_07896 [Streptomyces sp. 769]
MPDPRHPLTGSCFAGAGAPRRNALVRSIPDCDMVRRDQADGQAGVGLNMPQSGRVESVGGPANQAVSRCRSRSRSVAGPP